MPSLWTYARAAANPMARRLGYYTAYPLTGHEYVGRARLDVDGAQYYLQQNGYVPQRLSAAKRHPDTGQLHDLSMRRVPTVHPDGAADTRLTRRFTPAQCQLHVHAFELDGAVECFSHYEVRPDLLRPTPSIGRLRTHYRPQWGQDYLRGVTDLDI